MCFLPENFHDIRKNAQFQPCQSVEVESVENKTPLDANQGYLSLAFSSTGFHNVTFSTPANQARPS